MMVVSSPDLPDYGTGIDRMLMIYGFISAAGALLSLILIKEKPPTPPSAEKLEHKKFFAGLKHILSQRDMIITLILFFIGLGYFQRGQFNGRFNISITRRG